MLYKDLWLTVLFYCRIYNKLTLVYVSSDLEEAAHESASEFTVILGVFSEGTWLKYYKPSVRLLTKIIRAKQVAVKLDSINPLSLLCKQLSPDDTVITFNWDTLVELQLNVLGKPFSLFRSDGARTGILKLHGSLSWVQPPPNVKPKHMEYFELLDEASNTYRSKDNLEGDSRVLPLVKGKGIKESFLIDNFSLGFSNDALEE